MQACPHSKPSSAIPRNSRIVSRALKRPLVFTNGVFDILHRGHVTYLAEARALGASLVVALNSDASARRLGKGDDRPVNTLEDRMAVVAALESVALVTWFDEDTPIQRILACKPDHLVKGGDWSVDGSWARRKSPVGAARCTRSRSGTTARPRSSSRRSARERSRRSRRPRRRAEGHRRRERGDRRRSRARALRERLARPVPRPRRRRREARQHGGSLACRRSSSPSGASPSCRRAATPACAAARPRRAGTQVVVNLSRMNRVRDVDPANNTMTVEAGCVLATLQETADEADRLFPLSLGAEGSCEIGGNLSTNAGGTGVLRYGNTRELVLGLEVVLPDGRVWDGPARAAQGQHRLRPEAALHRRRRHARHHHRRGAEALPEAALAGDRLRRGGRPARGADAPRVPPRRAWASASPASSSSRASAWTSSSGTSPARAIPSRSPIAGTCWSSSPTAPRAMRSRRCFEEALGEATEAGRSTTA